jgi:hypothetical protein
MYSHGGLALISEAYRERFLQRNGSPFVFAALHECLDVVAKLRPAPRPSGALPLGGGQVHGPLHNRIAICISRCCVIESLQ